MKILIVYYSQSGNTQKVARAIRDGMRSAGHEVDLRFLRFVSFEDLPHYDMIGFGAPIWYEMPPNVRRFVEDMPALPGKLAFAFNTHGTLPALYFPLAIPRLQRKGLTVLGWKDWYADCFLQTFPEPYFTAGHPDETDLAEANAFGREICTRAEAYLAGDTSVVPDAPEPCMSLTHANIAIDHLGGFHNAHGRLVRDPEKCLWPGCHICMDNCTMGYIDLGQGRFGSCGDACDDCHGCTYCEMLCPVGAIRPVVPYEVAAPVGTDTGHTFFAATLRDAEKRGEFRRLLPEEDVGSTTPFYSVHPDHPRMRPLSFEED